MSLILDALNRAEHERKNKDAVPDISTIHSVPDYSVKSQPPKRTPIFFIVLLLLIIAIVAGLGWYFFKPSAPDRQPPAVHSQNNEVLLNQTPVVNSAPAELAPAGPAETQSDTPVNKHTVPSADQSTETATAVAPSAVDDLYSEQAEPATAAPNDDVDQLYAVEEVAPVSEPVVPPFVTEELPPIEEPALPQEPSVVESRRFESVQELDFNELPWNQKQQIPSISYSRHNYVPGGASSVVINGQTLGVGNNASGQLIIDEIFVDGVVLRFANKKFKLRALTGWINM